MAQFTAQIRFPRIQVWNMSHILGMMDMKKAVWEEGEVILRLECGSPKSC